MPEDKLGRQQALGSPGLFRRVQDAAPIEAGPDRLERAQAVLREVEGEVSVRPVARPSAAAKEAIAVEKRGRGRPRAEGEGPWVAAGVSRRTWYRRKAVEGSGEAT